MNPQFLFNNSHWLEPGSFNQQDPNLYWLSQQPYIHYPRLIQQLPQNIPGIYSITGGRQIGKTTLLKQWMWHLLQEGNPPKSIVFLTGEIIDDHHRLLAILQEILSETPQKKIHYIIVDEVTYIRDWDKAIKFAADSGLLRNVVLMLSGSDLTLVHEARMRFPGRRGKADQVDFHLYPLSFREFLELKKKNITINKILNAKKGLTDQDMDVLYKEFNQYLLHGGFLTAINDYELHQKILPATLTTYSDWIRGDMLKRHKSETYLREILSAIIKRYTSQVTWNSLAADLSIDHPATVADYIQLLNSLDAVFIQSALLEHKLVAAPKKARKIIFTDPFIYHATQQWLKPQIKPFEDKMLPIIHDPILSSQLVEACVVSHVRRFYPTYYIKSDGEVDIAYIHDEKFWPIEIKWGNQLRPHELKQISKYPNARIFSKQRHESKINGFNIESLPLALLQFS